MNPLVVSATVFCLLWIVGGAVYRALYGMHRLVQQRLEEVTVRISVAQAQAGTIDESNTAIGSSIVQWALKRMPQGKERLSAKTSRALVRAGFIRSNAIRIFQLIRLTAAIAGGALGLITGVMMYGSGPKPMLLLILGIGVGAYAPSYYLARRGRIRQSRIAKQLSDVLDLLVVCVEAGLGLLEAIKVVGDEAENHGQEIGTELTLVTGEVSAGSSLGQALRNLGERTAVADVKPLAATLIQSEQLGAQIAPALRAASDAMRSKRRLRAEEAAQKSTIKILFPLVLFILPAMLLVIIAPALIQSIHTLSGT